MAAIAASLAALVFRPASAAEPPPAIAPAPAVAVMDEQFKQDIQPFLQANCYKCHGNGKHKGDVVLDKFTGFDSVRADPETWGKVQDELEQHEMPPKKQPQPPAEQLARMIRFASQALELAADAGPHDPGFVAIHRLNRNEYNNTIRDLVGIDDFQPAKDFPADDTGYGFDNIADVLSMSPLLAEKYLNAAEQVMDKAIVTENPFKRKTARYPAEEMSGGEKLGDGHRILATNGEIVQKHRFIAAAEYEFRIEAEADQAGDEPAKMKVTVGGKEIRTFDVKNRRGHPKTFTFRTRVEAGEQQMSFAFINDFYDPQAKNPKRRDRNLIVDSVEVEGPIDLPPPPPSDVQKRLLFCEPADGAEAESCAQRVTRTFATRAFRRPATDEEVGRLMGLYRQSRAQENSFDQACKLALTAVLVSPQFIYRVELDPPDSQAAHPIDDYELATRLSYFLWSSMPDDELIKLAGENKLHDPATLDGQVKRMLGDDRSAAFVSNFAGQWLELRNLSFSSPDPKVFADFDPSLRGDMRREGELFFRSLVKDDRSVLDLIDCNYTFLNEKLAHFYGIDGVSGDEFRKVELTGEQARRRGGVLTMAGVLTVTALPTRTSPMRRGKFILDQILGTPPPPPPNDVPPLSQNEHDVSSMSLRQRLEAHRANPACASCHQKLDPLGFALENYDAIGRWRDKDGQFPIDSAGTLPSGEAIDGPDSLKHVLMNHKDQFLKCFIGKLMTYALGRGTRPSDAAMIAGIARQAAAHDYKFSSVIGGIVHSDAFLKRRPKRAGEQRVAATVTLPVESKGSIP